LLLLIFVLVLFLSSSLPFLDLHSFPTRRSSDLFIRGPRREISDFSVWHKKALLVQERQRYARKRITEPLQGILSAAGAADCRRTDRKSTRLNSSHVSISYAVFCLKKKQCIADRE